MVHIGNNGGSGHIPSAGGPDGPSTVGGTTATPAGGSGHSGPVDSGSSIAGGLAVTAPAAAAASGVQIVKTLAQKDKASGEKIIDILTKPTRSSSTSATYKLPGRTLKPGQSIYFAVPDALHGRAVKFMILSHRQDPSKDTDPTPGDDWDDTPGLTSVQVHSSQLEEGQQWRYWGGSASGGKGAKFAEVSHSPEIENLYEWRQKGHHSASGGGSSKAPLLPDAMRVKATGQDPIQLHEITLKVDAPLADTFMDAVFCEGTKIGDPETGAGRKYGGGQGYEGTFPGALELRSWGGTGGAGAAKLPEGWNVSGGRLEIDLPAGQRLMSIDVACGDSHPDKITNSDGGWGTKGWSKLSAGLQKKGSGAIDWFMNRENVPPEGVMTGSPTDLDYVTQTGDKLIVRAQSDTTYVMAARVGMGKVGEPDPDPEPSPVDFAKDGTVKKDEEQHFEIPIDADGKLLVEMTGTKDADVYLRVGAPPTVDEWNFRPYESTSDESGTIDVKKDTVLYGMVRGWAPESKYDLTVKSDPEG